MLKLIKADNGMTIFGQGIRIIAFTLPAVVLGMALHWYAPGAARLPLPESVMIPLGCALLIPGFSLWITAVIQLLMGFPNGKLVSTGAYGICRNPIYAAWGLFILPGISLVAGVWVYLFAGLTLCTAVVLFIRNEEADLVRIFGDQYRQYSSRVNRLIPFMRSRTGIS